MVQLEKTQEVSSQIQKPKIEVCKIEFNQKILEVLKKHNISPNQIEKYIPLLQNYKLELDDLNKKLEIITLTAKINCPDESENIIATMYSTSSGFKGLEEKLFRNLLSENISKIVGDLSFNSQALIDVLVRNLFERTADVGVLSKDKDIINFLQTKDNTGLSQKLKSYVSKYSVYDDVLIFDENGQLSGSINNYDGEKILDRELFEKIKNSDTFEEVYYSKNQVTNKENALMFYQKIVDENNKFLGVLALSFDFSGEIKKLFQNLSKDNDKSIKLLLSKDGNVIFSSDENIKTGTNLKFSPNSLYEIIKIGSTDYIAVSNQANEYEGFKGLGSIGAILLPLDKAFESENLNVDLNDDILATASSLCPELNSILESAGVVNRDLSRVVWNGEIISTHSQDNEILRPILRDISKTGDDIQSTIAKAINSLYSVVLRGSLKRALNIATLMADIMDRNLYERANDVRWWALINELIIAIGNNDIKKIDEILSDTNFLYTVYDNIYVFDLIGNIISSSFLDETKRVGFLGKKVDEKNLEKVKNLSSSDKYAVSDFQEDVVSNKMTYTYLAGIKSGNETIGGIGLAFDSENQFKKILNDCLPSEKGSFGLFLDTQGNIISSTDENYCVGDKFEIDKSFFELKSGEGKNEIIELNGHYYIVGGKKSAGYREYKTTDGYKNDVLALCFIDIGEVKKSKKSQKIQLVNDKDFEGDKTNISTFILAGQVYGFYTKDVVEAINIDKTTSLPGYNNTIHSSISYNGTIVPLINMKKIFNLKDNSEFTQIILLNSSKGLVGVLVDDLNQINQFDSKNITDVKFKSFSSGIINSQNKVFNLLDLEKIVNYVG